MVVSKKKIRANRRNAQLSTGPNDTSRTRLNALKHGVLSEAVLIRAGDGAGDASEFRAFSDKMREDLAPEGALEELEVEKLIGIAWRNGRLLAYESAVISKQRDQAIKDWEEQHPLVQAHKQWTNRQSRQGEAKQPRQWEPGQPYEWAIKQPGDSVRKYPLGPRVTPIDFYILLYFMQALALRELAKDEPLESAVVRSMVCHKAQKLGVHLDDVIGSKPESELYGDCSPEQVQNVIDAACELKNISQDDFWDAVDTDELRHSKGTVEALVRIESERDRAGDVAGIPDDACLGTIQRYDAHLTRDFHKTLQGLQQLQAARLSLRSPTPLAVDVDMGEDPTK